MANHDDQPFTGINVTYNPPSSSPSPHTPANPQRKPRKRRPSSPDIHHASTEVKKPKVESAEEATNGVTAESSSLPFPGCGQLPSVWYTTGAALLEARHPSTRAGPSTAIPDTSASATKSSLHRPPLTAATTSNKGSSSTTQLTTSASKPKASMPRPSLTPASMLTKPILEPSPLPPPGPPPRFLTMDDNIDITVSLNGTSTQMDVQMSTKYGNDVTTMPRGISVANSGANAPTIGVTGVSGVGDVKTQASLQFATSSETFKYDSAFDQQSTNTPFTVSSHSLPTYTTSTYRGPNLHSHASVWADEAPVPPSFAPDVADGPSRVAEMTSTTNQWPTASVYGYSAGGITSNAIGPAPTQLYQATSLQHSTPTINSNRSFHPACNSPSYQASDSATSQPFGSTTYQTSYPTSYHATASDRFQAAAHTLNRRPSATASQVTTPAPRPSPSPVPHQEFETMASTSFHASQPNPTPLSNDAAYNQSQPRSITPPGLPNHVSQPQSNPGIQTHHHHLQPTSRQPTPTPAPSTITGFPPSQYVPASVIYTHVAQPRNPRLIYPTPYDGPTTPGGTRIPLPADMYTATTENLDNPLSGHVDVQRLARFATYHADWAEFLRRGNGNEEAWWLYRRMSGKGGYRVSGWEAEYEMNWNGRLVRKG